MYELELREKVREINDLWIPDYVSKEERNRLLQGYKLKKTYLSKIQQEDSIFSKMEMNC